MTGTSFHESSINRGPCRADPVSVPSPLDDDDAEIARARELFARQTAARWRVAQTTADERIAKLRRLRSAVLHHRQAVLDAVRADFRKAPAETDVSEVLPTLGELSTAIRQVKRWMRPRRVGGPWFLFGTASEIRYEARGVALILGPFNYPFGLMMTPLVAAVAAGNCAILRPSEKTPHTAAVVARIVEDAFPEGEAAVVTGGVAVAEALLKLPFDHFFFTGSPAVGRRVMHAAAEHLASVTLELGGKSPAIVDETADVDAAARHLVWGKFVNAGQTCIAPDYVLVHESVAAALEQALARQISAVYGAGEATRRESADLCRMIDPAAQARVQRLVDESVADGARIVVGGAGDEAERYVAPTVLADVPADAAVMREEIFGPVLPVLPFRSLDDAIARVRALPHPLAMYVFSRSDENVERVLRDTTSGGVVVNDVFLHFGNPELPFGGVGESGFGAYHGVHGFRAFSHARGVLRQNRLGMSRLFHPPYDARTERVLALIRRTLR
jgi:aldehyde dehydrogenase (NAD+)